MKVFICKFSNEEDIEHQVGKRVSRVQTLFGNKLKVFCVDPQVQQRLEMAGIRAEVLTDFHQHIGVDDESGWEEFYQLSDKLHSSAENDDTLKYSGINLLTFEYHIIEYIFAIKLSKLCKRMVEQNCGVLVLVLTNSYVGWFPDLDSSNIKTFRFGRGEAVRSLAITRFCYHVMHEGYLLLTYAKDRFQKLFAKKCPVSTEGIELKQSRVLFSVSSTVPYARPALAIYNECLRNGLTPYIATDDRTLIPLLKLHQIEYSIKPPLLISLFSGASQIGKTLLMSSRFKNHLNSFYGNTGKPDVKHDEFSAAHLCKEILLDKLTRFCFEAISDIDFLEGLIKTTSPDIICLMPQSDFLQQMASALAKTKYNIPTLASSAAWETADSRSFKRHLHADKIVVMGEGIKETYLESGLEPGRIVVTGVAHFDLLFNRNKEQDDKILSECGICPSSRIIMFATQNISGGETEQSLIGVISVVLKFEDIQLVIKVHPQEDIAICQAIAERYHNPRIHVVKDIEVYALISRCELLITKHSTTALEAMLVDKPVITINLSAQPSHVLYAEEGASLGVNRYEDIEPAIMKALYDKEIRSRLQAAREKFIRRWAGEPDGQASQRIVNVMKEMIATPIEQRANQG